MDKELLGNGNPEQKKKITKTEELFRIAVTKKVDEEISEMLIKINDGFTAGKVNRPQLVSWIISKFCESLDETDIKAIRADHFDEFAMFESVMRQAKELGQFPPEFKALMQKHMGIEDTPKRSRTKIDK